MIEPFRPEPRRPLQYAGAFLLPEEAGYYDKWNAKEKEKAALSIMNRDLTYIPHLVHSFMTSCTHLFSIMVT